MSGTDDARVPCIACGAPNPPDSDVCESCGIRFAGPDPGSPAPRMRPEPAGAHRSREATALRVLAALGSIAGAIVAVLVIGVLTLISLVIGVLITCSIDPKLGFLAIDLGALGLLTLVVAGGLGWILRAAIRGRNAPAKENL